MVLLRFRSKFLPYAAGTCHSILRKKDEGGPLCIPLPNAPNTSLVPI